MLSASCLLRCVGTLRILRGGCYGSGLEECLDRLILRTQQNRCSEWSNSARTTLARTFQRRSYAPRKNQGGFSTQYNSMTWNTFIYIRGSEGVLRNLVCTLTTFGDLRLRTGFASQSVTLFVSSLVRDCLLDEFEIPTDSVFLNHFLSGTSRYKISSVSANSLLNSAALTSTL